jgi:excisionase family DNA binding protein
MPKLSPREAVKVYQVSRATLMKALSEGTLSGTKDGVGHWRIDAAELMRVYQPRETKAVVNRTKPAHVSRSEPVQKADVNQDVSARLAIAEAALEAEREKTVLLQRHLDDVRRMLPPPESPSEPALRPNRRSWWPWNTNK